uniref:Uncharacterized protein n=1 Tax=Hyaloperonospora arabidopsidis (strain Emoy2) TaxID=559515 RepID=M4BR30_HYAAE
MGGRKTAVRLNGTRCIQNVNVLEHYEVVWHQKRQLPMGLANAYAINGGHVQDYADATMWATGNMIPSSVWDYTEGAGAQMAML